MAKTLGCGQPGGEGEAPAMNTIVVEPFDRQPVSDMYAPPSAGVAPSVAHVAPRLRLLPPNSVRSPGSRV